MNRKPESWDHLKDPGRGADTQALRQAHQDPHDQFHRRLLAMKNRAVRFQKVPVAAEAVELPPRATTGMPIRPQIVEPQPAAIVTSGVGTKVPRGIHYTGMAVGWRHGIGPYRRRWSGIRGRLLTQGTGRFVRQARL